jgi:hypothetical protein
MNAPLQQFFRQIRAGLDSITIGRLICTADKPISLSSGRQTTWIGEAEAINIATALLEASRAPITVLRWQDPATTLPDDDEPVFIRDKDDEPWIGFLDGGVWRDADAMPISWEVSAWAKIGSQP